MKLRELYNNESLRNVKQSWLLYGALGTIGLASVCAGVESQTNIDTLLQSASHAVVFRFNPDGSDVNTANTTPQPVAMMPAAISTPMEVPGYVDYLVPGLGVAAELMVAGDYALRVRRDKNQFKGEPTPPREEYAELTNQERSDFWAIIDETFPYKY